jgi:hypothetical protein
MTKALKTRSFFSRYWKRILIFLSVFGPATITAMSDNDAGGVATYSISGAKLGYPILFLLIPITILLGVTQEMGMRLAIISRRGLADLIRERFGVKTAMFMFGALLVANLGNQQDAFSAGDPIRSFDPGGFIHLHCKRELQADAIDHAALQPVLYKLYFLSSDVSSRLGSGGQQPGLPPRR